MSNTHVHTHTHTHSHTHTPSAHLVVALGRPCMHVKHTHTHTHTHTHSICPPCCLSWLPLLACQTPTCTHTHTHTPSAHLVVALGRPCQHVKHSRSLPHHPLPQRRLLEGVHDHAASELLSSCRCRRAGGSPQRTSHSACVKCNRHCIIGYSEMV